MTSDGSDEPEDSGEALPDLAYIVRPPRPDEAATDSHAELRYSLRSVAANVSGYRKVWIIGSVPEWVRNVHSVNLAPLSVKAANIRQSVTVFCKVEDVADRVVIFNDDHFVTGPVDARTMPAFHLGPVSKFVSRLLLGGRCGPGNTWLQAMRSTAEWMEQQGYGDPLAYEAHTPLLFDVARLRDVIVEYPADRPLAYPELYSVAGAGGAGRRVGNAKVATLDSGELLPKLAQDMPFLSTNDRSFDNGMVGGYLRGMFREPSPYES